MKGALPYNSHTHTKNHKMMLKHYVVRSSGDMHIAYTIQPQLLYIICYLHALKERSYA